jgi:hypothetical protein
VEKENMIMDDDNVVKFSGLTTHDIPVDKVLCGAWAANLEIVLVLGRKPDGEVFYATSTGEKKELVYLLECCKYDLLKLEYNE